MKEALETIVIGGGLGGLCSAALLAQAGHSVRLLEQGQRLGGRARSREQAGFIHDLGAHALYREGPAKRVLSQLKIDAPGGRVGSAGTYVLRAGRLHRLPAGFGSLLSTEVVGARAKLRLAGLMLSLGERTAAAASGKRVDQWSMPRIWFKTRSSAPCKGHRPISIASCVPGVRDERLRIELPCSGSSSTGERGHVLAPEADPEHPRGNAAHALQREQTPQQRRHLDLLTVVFFSHGRGDHALLDLHL
jgi:hypothetical protein